MRIARAFVWAALAGAAGPLLAIPAEAAPPTAIIGRAVAGPVCPVERVPPDPRCAPRPVRATIRIAGAGTVREVDTDAAGRFSLRVRPGRYRLSAVARSSSPFPRPPTPRSVTVRAHHTVRVTLLFDTGIR